MPSTLSTALVRNGTACPTVISRPPNGPPASVTVESLASFSAIACGSCSSGTTPRSMAFDVFSNSPSRTENSTTIHSSAIGSTWAYGPPNAGAFAPLTPWPLVFGALPNSITAAAATAESTTPDAPQISMSVRRSYRS